MRRIDVVVAGGRFAMMDGQSMRGEMDIANSFVMIAMPIGVTGGRRLRLFAIGNMPVVADAWGLFS